MANQLFGAKELEKWNQDGVVVVPNMFEWLVKAEVFEDLLMEVDMLDHHYSGHFALQLTLKCPPDRLRS